MQQQLSTRTTTLTYPSRAPQMATIEDMGTAANNERAGITSTACVDMVPSSRRRLAFSMQTEDHYGRVRTRYFNAEGYDAWGYDVEGNFDSNQVVMDCGNPFSH